MNPGMVTSVGQYPFCFGPHSRVFPGRQERQCAQQRFGIQEPAQLASRCLVNDQAQPCRHIRPIQCQPQFRTFPGEVNFQHIVWPTWRTCRGSTRFGRPTDRAGQHRTGGRHRGSGGERTCSRIQFVHGQDSRDDTGARPCQPNQAGQQTCRPDCRCNAGPRIGSGKHVSRTASESGVGLGRPSLCSCRQA